MQLKRLLVAVFPLLAVKGLEAQYNSDVINYINTYKELAISEMQRSGVPAAITLAQGIHETMAGKSELVRKSKNHFGIKCKSTWTGGKVYHDDDARGECFRAYATAEESYADHSDFLRRNGRYAFLFDYDPTDYTKWAYGLKKAGYATNNRYPQILIKYIEDYNLQQYTLIAMGKLKPKDEILAGNGKPVSDMAISNGVAIRDIPVDIAPPKPTREYPAGEFRINETKVIYAKAGTSLLSIAEQYNIGLKRLLDFNDMQEEEVLKQDQLIYLQRKRKTGASEFHVVQAGETLYDICQTEAIRLESLLAYNHLQGQLTPAVGEKLYLHGKAPARPRLAQDVAVATPAQPDIRFNQVTSTNTSAISATTHIVRGKETLYSIAKKYGTTIDQIREWNQLAGYDLKAGQELVIYK
jgi:Muramidase (flagellum-specific)